MASAWPETELGGMLSKSPRLFSAAAIVAGSLLGPSAAIALDAHADPAVSARRSLLPSTVLERRSTREERSSDSSSKSSAVSVKHGVARTHAVRVASVQATAARQSTQKKAPATTTPAPATTVASAPTRGAVVAPVITGTTYYVSPTGKDSNSGTSPSQAWQTVNRANEAQLKAGDGVLFQGGATFSDAVLQPADSGTAQASIVYGSYGSGQAVISQGAWFVENYVALENLGFDGTVYVGSSVSGTSNDAFVDDINVQLAAGNAALGFYANGNNETIENSTINNSALSGMLLNGDSYLITGNTITNTGWDTANGYNNHGIYLDASDATITHNTISNFAESAISVRYHSSVIEDNLLEDGQIGIDFYQTDTAAGSSVWESNQITGTTVAGMYIAPSGAGGNTMENFTIESNTLHISAGVELNLHPSTGTETVQANTLD